MNVEILNSLWLLQILLYAFGHVVGEFENHTEFTEETENVSIFVDDKIVRSTLINGTHALHITVQMNFRNTSYIVDLTLNTNLVASTYVEKVITENGTIFRHFNQSEEMCYYVGQLRNHSKSRAAFSTCEGLRGFFVLDNFTFHVRPLRVGSIDQVKSYKIKMTMNDNLSTWICGVGDFKYRFKRGASPRVKRQINADAMDEQKIVELYVANDVRRLNYFNGSLNKLRASTREIVNTANMLYQPVGFFVVLIGAEYWTVDQINVVTNSTATLLSWDAYRANKIQQYNDVGFLISFQTFSGGVLGLAHVRTMCSSQNSSGIMRAIDDNSAVSGAILAHEIGHVFGLSHDSVECVCEESPDVSCIMSTYASLQKPSLYFSSCSKYQLNTSVEKGFDVCLKNFPSDQSSHYQMCGNGILEYGEECDCGRRPSRECNSGCCNATTCRLIGQAKCASGKCCDVNTCQLRQAGFRCRPTIGPCDITEVCNGTSAYCPKNVYKHDGIACSANGVNTYCWGGMCRSQRSQCNELYGPSSNESNRLCYEVYNTYGNEYGYCSFQNNTYTPCQLDNTMCGSLKCDTKVNTLIRYTNFVSKTSGTVEQYRCVGVVLDYGSSVENPGMVPNGAACGVGKMCVSQKCLSVGTIFNENPCPPCNDRICTNEGKCVCDPDLTCIISESSTTRSTTTDSTTRSTTTASTTQSTTTRSTTTATKVGSTTIPTTTNERMQPATVPNIGTTQNGYTVTKLGMTSIGQSTRMLPMPTNGPSSFTYKTTENPVSLSFSPFITSSTARSNYVTISTNGPSSFPYKTENPVFLTTRPFSFTTTYKTTINPLSTGFLPTITTSAARLGSATIKSTTRATLAVLNSASKFFGTTILLAFFTSFAHWLFLAVYSD